MRMAQRAIQQHHQYQIHEEVVDQVFKFSRAKMAIDQIDQIDQSDQIPLVAQLWLH